MSPTQAREIKIARSKLAMKKKVLELVLDEDSDDN